MSIVGVALGDPYSARTFSGSSGGLFRALRQRTNDLVALSALPPKAKQYYYKALSFRLNRDDWVFRYRLRPDLYDCNTRVAKAKLRQFPADRYNVVLQIAAFYNLANLAGRLTVSYHDATLATLLRSRFGGRPKRDSVVAASLEYERRLYHQVNHIFTMSEWAKRSLISDFSVPAEKITVAGAGVNLRRLAAMSDKSYEAPSILFVGKEFPRKGGDTLLRAFVQARERIPGATLTIVGPRTIGEVPEGVNFVGRLDNDTETGLSRLLHEYQRASIFAMPSVYEPFGIVFLEAMAHGLPCLGSDQCAMPEIIVHEKTGFVQPVDDLQALIDSLCVLLENVELRRKMGQLAKLRYENEYGWDRTAQIIDEVTSRLVVESGCAPSSA